MNNILISSNNTMNIELEIKSLVDSDKARFGIQSYQPTVLYRRGEPTKKALAFNRKMIREGKTTKYLDKNQLYNLDTNRVIQRSKVADGRKKKIAIGYFSGLRPIKQSFKNDYNIQDSVFSRKKTTIVKSYVYIAPDLDDDDLGITTLRWEEYDGKDDLNNFRLMLKQMQDENITGKWRVLIQIDGQNVVDTNIDVSTPKTWYKDKGDLPPFRVSSDYMIWHYPIDEGGLVSEGTEVKFIYTKEKKLTKRYYEQTYADSLVGRCLLQPIYDWVQGKIEEAETKKTKAKYTTLLNLFNGKKSKDKKKRTNDKVGLFQKYKNGVPEKEIAHLCELLQIGIDIDQPFSQEVLYSYRSMKKPLKVFKWLNTRLNHVEVATDKKFDENSLFKKYDTVYVKDRISLLEIRKELEEEGKFYTFTKNGYGTNSISTLEQNIRIQSDYNDIAGIFEHETNLKHCNIDAREYPDLYKFISDGTHFNGCVDFIDTESFKKKIPDNIRHIDMTKAYTQFKKCKWYDGFALNITDFRSCSEIKGNGFYYIESIDLSGCNEKFIKLNSWLNWYIAGNIYTKEELEALTEYGGKYQISYGAYGLKDEFEFSDEMINTKDVIKFNDMEIKIPFYSKWCGMNCCIAEEKSFFMKGLPEYFQNINTDADITYYDNEARISYFNKYQYNKKHITGQITAYQRLHMLDQMMNMDIDKIVRICTDGIYFKEHDFKISEVFSKKEKMTFQNDPAMDYLSGMINEDKGLFVMPEKVPERGHYKSEIYDSAGGDGKTYTNLFLEKGFVNVVYAPHSNKLQSTMRNEYKKEFGKRLRTTNHHRLLEEPFSITEGEVYKYNVYLIDECSMLTENQKAYMLKKIKGKVIFLGDTKCQCLPIKGSVMTHDMIDNVAEKSKKNYRFKDSNQLDACNYVRDVIINGGKVSASRLPYQRIKKEEMSKHYDKKDIILVTQHKYNDEWNQKFKDLEKYKVTNNTRDYFNGDIIYEKIKKVQTEFRHGYTIHSVQGETFKNKIFIDMRKMKDMRMFYTAISRAEYSKQIFLII